MSHLIGKFVWFELSTRDLQRAKGFYGELFGWRTEAMSMGPGSEYTLIKNGETPVAGYTDAAGGPSRWVSYLSVSDVDAAAQRAIAAGGQQVAPAFDVPTIGRMAELRDNTGASVFLFAAADGDQPDHDTVAGDFYWNELLTSDPSKAVAFYQAVAGYTVAPMEMGPMGTYHVLKSGEVSRAGIMKTPVPGAPNAWLPYIRVADADQTAARATKLGGSVMGPPTDIPTVGRFAVLTDPTGAHIAVIAPAPAAK